MKVKHFCLLFTIIVLLMSKCVIADESDEQSNVFLFGQYEQDNNEDNGKEPLEWIVLDEVDGKALITTLRAIDCQKYNTESGKDVTWETSSLRNWLNNEFYKTAFTEEEKKAVLEVTILNTLLNGKPEWETDGGRDTTDRVFLLSVYEFNKYFGIENDKCSPTEYAKKRGAKKWFSDETVWWLRSPGKKQNEACYVGNGKIESSLTTNNTVGVCPAIVIDINADWDSFPASIFDKAVETAVSGNDHYENYKLAADIFKTLDTYNDAKEQTASCLFLYAVNAMDAGLFDEALAGWDEYEKYCDNILGHMDPEYPGLRFECEKSIAKSKADEGDIESYELFVNNQVALGNFQVSYEYAVELLEKQEYKKAIEFFLINIDYEDSKEKIDQCKKALADISFETENYTDMKSYIDEHLLINDLEPCYVYAVRLEENGKYKEAISLFTKIYRYKDSFTHLLKCFDEEGIKHELAASKNRSIANVGNKKREYGENRLSTRDDPHNGWQLGEFIISGYVDLIEKDGVTTYYKGMGNQIQLWFNLKQNIDMLNNEKAKIVIGDEKDGYDINYPELRPQPFGKGALLVRFIPDVGKNDNTEIYRDYLASAETETANIIIDLNETGTYEIALDYLVHSTDIRHIINPDNRYRIFFSLEVKDGSSMFFIRNLADSEVDDYSVVTDGFYLEAAGSGDLSFHVTRKSIRSDNNGLDVRDSSRAREKEKFTTPGYYIIQCTNKETGAMIEKKIFVGTYDELRQYKQVSTELDGFTIE